MIEKIEKGERWSRERWFREVVSRKADKRKEKEKKKGRRRKEREREEREEREREQRVITLLRFVALRSNLTIVVISPQQQLSIRCHSSRMTPSRTQPNHIAHRCDSLRREKTLAFCTPH